MLHQIIKDKKNRWIESERCTVRSLIGYIRRKGEFRDAQIEAIETYLWLKIAGKNKPLRQLFSEGFFSTVTELEALNINQRTREFLKNNPSALALYDFSRQRNGKGALLPEIEKIILEKPEQINYENVIASFFYNVGYSDYLFSLPMGAGKTFLMAAFMYLDLYFALNEPQNKIFAHNFLVLVPSGLKSSIVPSLKTIEKFDPSWILPEPSASRIKGMIRFEVLDQPKSAKRSNKARNPNAQKVNQYISQQDLMGLTLVVNAEKVILDRLDLSTRDELIEHTEDERDRFANELRNIIGKIPNLQIMIDEVHHAAKDDIKLRQVVNKWSAKGNIATVLGFSGTPNLSTPDKIVIDDKTTLKFSQITNTVYYYSLISGIKNFLKKPSVKIADMEEPLHIIEQGIEDFYARYQDKIYGNGTIPKLAIYCGTIPRLEKEIYPFVAQLIKKFGDTEENVLKFHKGNKDFKLPKQNELQFNSLDTALSNKRIILLVQIGKEGWDCKSLTSVILAQKGDCPTNMVLQTSCRCLRQVDKQQEETALIWLNQLNARTLNKQLVDEQHTTIAEINNLVRAPVVDTVPRYSRLEYLQLPEVEFYQLKVKFQTIQEAKRPETASKIQDVLQNISQYRQSKFIVTKKNFIVADDRSEVYSYGNEPAEFTEWLLDIVKESFGGLTLRQVEPYREQLKTIFDTITFPKSGRRVFNEVYRYHAISAQIRLAFRIKRTLKTTSDAVKKDARLLIVEKLHPVEKNPKLYPNEEDIRDILSSDASGKTIDEIEQGLKKFFDEQRKTLEEQGMGRFAPSQKTFSPAVRSKNSTFHYLPYNFFFSGFEKQLLEDTLTLSEFKNRRLEMYYNGERALTQFQIECYGLNRSYWKYFGKYTPDFLIVQRDGKRKLHKLLIIETKGEVFANDPKFIRRKDFVSSEFLRLNEERFGYKRFDFLLLNDSAEPNDNLSMLNRKILDFFEE